MKTTFGCERCSYICELKTKIDNKDDIPKACPYLIIVPEWKVLNNKKITNRIERLEYIIGILILLWIFSWFGAIWIYTIQLLWTGLFALILALLINGSLKDICQNEKYK